MSNDFELLYHFTSWFNLPLILKEKKLTLTTSNFSFEDFGLHPVVWLTSSPSPENMGLLFDPNMPDDLNKTHIRFSVYKEPYMESWDEWSDKKGMDKDLKQALIKSARAEETYKTWYVSECEIPLDDVYLVEDMVSGNQLYEDGDFEDM